MGFTSMNKDGEMYYFSFLFSFHIPEYFLLKLIVFLRDFPGGAMVESPPGNAGDVRDVRSISGSGRSPGRGHGNPLQYSYLENPMDRG